MGARRKGGVQTGAGGPRSRFAVMEQYKVIRAIGKGSFGKVYLVHHVAENRKYVLKVIKVKGMPQKERDATRNEVTIAAPFRVVAAEAGGVAAPAPETTHAPGG